MYTAIIAEDEILVRLGLSVSINWAKHGVRVVAEVANGTDAWDAYLKYRPDIVLTDIRMPGMDGLALIRRIREMDERCAIIVISALTDFATLHEVLRGDAVAYLIKATMTQEEIRAALEAAVARLQRLSPAVEAAGQASRARRYDLFQAYAIDGVVGLDAFLAQAKALGEPPRVHGASLLSIRGEGTAGGVPPMAARSVQRLVLQGLCPADGDLQLEREDCLVLLHTDGRPLPFERVELMMREQARYAQENFALRVRLCHCEAPIPLEGLPGFARNACALLAQHWLFGAPALRVDPAGLADDDELNTLVGALDHMIEGRLHALGTWKDARHALEELKPALRRSRGEFVERAAALLALLDVDGIAGLRAALEAAPTLQDMLGVLDGVVLAHYGQDDSTSQMKVGMVIRHMQEHLGEDMHLGQMAQLANLSPGYFSTLIKQCTGMRFSEYLTSLRMERAKALLRGTVLPVQQVAELCGIPDLAYFSRSFKARVGVSPSQWRKA